MMTTRSAVPTLSSVFDGVTRSASRISAQAERFTVAADVRENSREYTFQLDVPGVKAEDLDITLTNRVLAIRGARHLESGENEKVARGRPQGAFAASYSLPDGIEEETLTAELAEGVLTIRVPKHPKAQPRKIPIGHEANRPEPVS